MRHDYFINSESVWINMKYTSWHIALHWNLATGWQCNIKGWLCISDPPKGAPCIPPCWKSGVQRKRKKPNCCDLLIHSPGDSSDFEPSNILVEACAKSPWYQAPAQHLDFWIYIGWYFVVPDFTWISLMFCAELGGRKQIGFSLLGMAWTRTTRSCYVWGNGSTQPSAWKITPGISSSAESEETGRYNKRKGLIFWFIMAYIIHNSYELTLDRVAETQKSFENPCINRLIMIHRPFPTPQSAIFGLAMFGFRWILRLFVFCDHDKSGTLDWKEFKHLVRDTLSVPQEAVTLIAPVVRLCNVIHCNTL